MPFQYISTFLGLLTSFTAQLKPAKIIPTVVKNIKQVRKFDMNVATAWFPPPTLNPDQPARGRRNDYKMARRRECGRPDLSRLL